MRISKKLSLTALLVVMVLVATACQQQAGPKQGPAEQGQPGGTLVFAAEQYPKCLNWVTTCYNASWMHYITTLEVLPQLLTYDANNDYAPGIVKRIPTTDNGGVTASPFTVTYEIVEDAVWEDGSPITGDDVKFTQDALIKSAKSLFAEGPGYDLITEIAVDSSNPKKFTMKFKEPYAPWKDLFGGGTYVLKKAAFGGNPEVSDKMQTDLAGISGSAFKLESFSESETVLVRNDKYWGKKALLDKIVFKKISEQPAEINAFKTGEIHAFFPQPTTELVDQIKAVPGGEIGVKGGTVFEGIWLNMDKAPLNDKAVRTALLYGLDRQAAIDVIVKPVDPKATVNHCLWSTPGVAEGKWCPKDFPTKPDKAKATKALEDAGWKKGADGIYAKGGQKLSIKWATTAGNVGREQFQTIIQAQAKEIGIDIVLDNSDATTLFQTRLPARDFVMAMFAQVATPDPSVTSSTKSTQIPTKDNPDGQNYYGIKRTDLDKLLDQSDAEVDDAKRVKLFEQINDIIFEEIMSIPLYAKPQILVYNSQKLGGTFDFNAGQAGFAHQLKTWYFKNQADRT